jgi:hypothetical protein
MPNTPEGFIGSCARFAWCLVATVAVGSSSGCAALQGLDNYLTYNDSVNDFVLGYRNSVWARQAWFERKSQHYGEPQFSHFGAGFRSGYVSVASGGNGCPPAIPPREYWTWKYQTPEGQAQVAAWFAGYPYGAKAAEEDGAGLYQQIQVSHFIERQYSPDFGSSFAAEIQSEPGVPPSRSPEPATPSLPPIQDPPPGLDLQSSRGTPAASGWNSPMAPPGGVMPAAYQEPAKWTAAASIPTTVPVRTPSATPLPEFPTHAWPQSR